MNVRMLGWCPFLLVSVAAFGAHETRSRLLAESPFDSRRTAVNPAPASLPLEYVGFIQTIDGVQFRIRDRTLKKAAFVSLNTQDAELQVIPRRYDPDAGALMVEHQGRMLTLPEPKAKVRSSGPPATSPPLLRPSAYPVPAVIPRAVTVAVVSNSTAIADTTQLDAVAAEIRRRQEERQKAAQAAK
jgi:hypothetical protein